MGKRPPRRVGTKPGKRLRILRRQRGLTLRDVHAASVEIARESHRDAFVIFPSRLHEFEMKEVVPSIYGLYTLACVYKCRLGQLLSWYGIPPVLRS